PDRVVNARPWAADHRHHQVSPLELADCGTDLDHAAEALVSEDEKVGADGGLAVLGGLDLPVRAVHAHPENLDAHSAPTGAAGQLRAGKLGEVGAARPTREHGDGLHDTLLFGSAAAVSAAGISWLCCSSLATGPVQPV